VSSSWMSSVSGRSTGGRDGVYGVLLASFGAVFSENLILCPFYVRLKSFFGHKTVSLLSQFVAPSTQGALVDSGGVVGERNVGVDLAYPDGLMFGLVRVFAGHGFSFGLAWQ